VALVVGAVLLIVGAGTAALVAIVWSVQQRSPKNLVARSEEDEAERWEQLREAFKDRKPPTDKEIAQQVQRMLDALSEGLRSGMHARIMLYFDLERMVDELAVASGGALSLKK
jgi:hypothetical protein